MSIEHLNHKLLECGIVLGRALIARQQCADAINARAKAIAPGSPHPAFVANICGTLIEHPQHDGVTRVFAACPMCARAKAVR